MTSDDNRERRSVRLVGVVGVLILLASLAPRRVRAGDGVWTLTSEALWGLYVTQLVASPIFAADSTLFAATEEGIFRSADGARHWEPMNRGLAHLRVSSLAISPDYSNDRTLFAALADGGVYRSVDGGEHWTASWAGMVPPWNPDGQLVQVSGLGFSPSFADDNTLFASSWNDPIFKSVDGGATWTMLSSDAGPLSGQIEISPSYATDGTIFVTRALMADGIYKSTDGGATWERLMPTLPDQDLWQLAISPDYGADHTLFVRTERALFRSEDGGATWTHSSVGIVIDPDAALVFSPNYVVDRTMFVSTRHGVFASSDSGATWLPLHGGLDAYAGPILVVAPTRPLRLFAPLSYGLSGVWELTLTDPAPPPMNRRSSR